MRPQHGFTLLELMMVVAIIGLATTGATLALRDTQSSLLEQEALRLAALLESGRAQSRTSGVPVRWRITPNGFEFEGVAEKKYNTDSVSGSRAWLQSTTTARITEPARTDSLLLGPEPLIEAQRVSLQMGDRSLTLATDGLAPFAVIPEAETP